METHIEILDTAACALLPLAVQPRPLLDWWSPCSPRLAAPDMVPALRPGAGNNPPPAPRMPFLPTGLARGPRLAAPCLQVTRQRCHFGGLVVHFQAEHAEAHAQRCCVRNLAHPEASQQLHLCERPTIDHYLGCSYQRRGRPLGKGRNPWPRCHLTVDSGCTLISLPFLFLEFAS
jgi:hypothetical protein